VNTQSLLSVISTTTNVDANKTINMQRAVATQPNPAKLFITQPWSLAFKNKKAEGYVVSAASNIIVKLTVNLTDGTATVKRNPLDSTRVLQIKTGKNPRGIVINGADTRAYVMNEVSRKMRVKPLTAVLVRAKRMSDLPALHREHNVVPETQAVLPTGDHQHRAGECLPVMCLDE
jgi:DNA-binding beta-propeller fold protein YncE